MRVVLFVLSVGPDDFNLDPRFLEAFSDRSLVNRFTVLDFPSRELPVPGERYTGGALADEELPLVLHDRDGNRSRRRAR